VSDFTDRLMFEARKMLGVREEGGANRGTMIDIWNREAGAPVGSPWCASFVHAMHKAASDYLGIFNPCPRTASTHALWTMADPASKSSLPAPGDVFVVDHGLDAEGNRIGHCGIVIAVTPDGQTIVSIEGNTNAAGSREGDSVAQHTWRPRDGKRGTLLGYIAFDPGQAPADPEAKDDAQAHGETT